jgi:hypothetical protein
MPSVLAQTVKPQSANRGKSGADVSSERTQEARPDCRFAKRDAPSQSFWRHYALIKIPFTIPASDRPKQPPSGSRGLDAMFVMAGRDKVEGTIDRATIKSAEVAVRRQLPKARPLGSCR